MRRVTIFCTENINTPKSLNSRVQSPTGIFWSGCFGSSSLQATDPFPQSNVVTYGFQRFIGKQGNKVRWWEGPNVPFLSLRHWWCKSLTSELRGGDEWAEWVSRSRRALMSDFYVTDDVDSKKGHWGLIITFLDHHHFYCYPSFWSCIHVDQLDALPGRSYSFFFLDNSLLYVLVRWLHSNHSLVSTWTKTCFSPQLSCH